MEELKAALDTQVDTLAQLVKSGQYGDAFTACKDLQGGLNLISNAALQARVNRLETGMRELLEVKA